ncbi:Hypothetical predicted protein, partial [Podarcis lilfordi]
AGYGGEGMKSFDDSLALQSAEGWNRQMPIPVAHTPAPSSYAECAYFLCSERASVSFDFFPMHPIPQQMLYSALVRCSTGANIYTALCLQPAWSSANSNPATL